MAQDISVRSGIGRWVARAIALAGAIGLTVYLNRNNKPRLDARIAAAFLMSVEELDAAIVAGLASQDDAIEAKWAKSLGITLRELRALKKHIYAAPGQGLGYLIRLRGDGGEDFCKRIRWCAKKHAILEQLRRLNRAVDDGAVENDATDNEVRTIAPDVWETVSTAMVDLGELALDGLGVMIVVRGVKYGLDDICPCCAPCNGSGTLGSGGPCANCFGTGSRHPFLPQRKLPGSDPAI